MDELEKELKLSTLVELEDHLNELRDLLYGKNYSDFYDQDFEKIFRIAHSIKGNTKACGFDDIAHASHEFESKMIKVKNKEEVFDEDYYDICSLYLNMTSDVLELLKLNLESPVNYDDFFTRLNAPKSIPASPAPGPVEKPTLIKTQEIKNAEVKTKPKLKVLVADDDENILEIIESYINDNFTADMTLCEDGEEAYAISKVQLYDVIICDYMMPKIDGSAFITMLRSEKGGNQNCPIIFLSGYRPEIDPNAKVWENVFFADKPFTEQKLMYYIKCSMKLNMKEVA